MQTDLLGEALLLLPIPQTYIIRVIVEGVVVKEVKILLKTNTYITITTTTGSIPIIITEEQPPLLQLIKNTLAYLITATIIITAAYITIKAITKTRKRKETITVRI